MNELAINGGKPVRDTVLGYGHQCISNDDINAVVEVLQSGYLTCGPATEEFERLLSETIQAKYVTAVANGTAALHVACLAVGIKPGDEVIVSPITFAASANCVLYCGGTPVFADIDGDTWNISPISIEEAITDRTKAVVAVDFGGVPVDLSPIKEICQKHGLVLIEDAAHSLGSRYEGRPIGSIADITTFSFHPVKTITTGEGGAVATNDPELAKRILLFSKHGITRDLTLMENPDTGGWYYEQLELGFNYRISDVAAALGISQLKRLSEFAERRKRLVEFYNNEFESIDGVSFQKDSNPLDTVRHLYCVRFDLGKLNVTRKFLYDALKAEGIGVNVHYLPVYKLPYYVHKGYGDSDCPAADAYYEEAMTLPLHCCMDQSDAADVVEAVRKVVDWCKMNTMQAKL